MGVLDDEDDVVGFDEDDMGAGGGGILDGVGRRVENSGGELGGKRG